MTEINYQCVVIGGPGMGKTTYVKTKVIEHLTTHPKGVAIVHDVQRQFLDSCAPYKSTADYRAAVRAAIRTRATVQRGVAITEFEAWDSCVDLAIGMGELHNNAANVRVPILLVADESSAMAASGPTHMGRSDMRLAHQRRHWGIGTIHNLQKATALHPGFIDVCTEVVLFGQHNENHVRDLEPKLGLPKGALQGLVHAPPHRYVVWRQGQGLVS